MTTASASVPAPTSADAASHSTATPLGAGPISGVSPAEIRETTIMTVWPSNAMYPLGRFLGTLYAIRFPDVYFFTLGNLIALASIPIALVLYFMRILPFIGVRYRLTNRRIIVEQGLQGKELRSVPLDRYDNVEIVVRDGQAWYDAGDLVFKLGTLETFRLEGVSRPDAFRATCVDAQRGYSGVKQILARKK